jgi:hypothetical protein
MREDSLTKVIVGLQVRVSNLEVVSSVATPLTYLAGLRDRSLARCSPSSSDTALSASFMMAQIVDKNEFRG